MIQTKNIALNIPVNFFCNQKCFFCSEGDKDTFQYLKNNEDKVVYKLLEDGKGKFNQAMFTTGEPTLNKNICEYIKRARDLGYERIGMITNGSQLHRDDLRKKLLDSGLNEITFSIHGSNSVVHEKNIGVKGIYEKVILGLVKLRKDSKDIRIDISMVLNKYNLFDLFNCIFKYQKLGINIFLVNTMRPDGYGKDRMKELSIKYSDFIEYINGLPEKKLQYLNGLIENNKLNIMDIPICILEQTRLSVKAYGMVEIRVVENLEEINTVENKIYVDKCRKCKYNSQCEGVYKDYIKSFGEGEFSK